tara:strand:+ start:3886 stop:4566 length:681 start_codon:yes stop_codon:yes gene_type:complete
MKVLFVTDSLGLPRPDRKVLASETWCYLVANKLQTIGNSFQCFFQQIGGLQTKQLLLHSREGYLAGFDTDIILLQVGIVDCSPRVLPERLRNIIAMIPVVRGIVRTIIRNNHKWLSTKIDRSYISLTAYEKNLKEFKEIFGDVTIFALPIAPANRGYKEHTPLIERNIREYNKILKKVFGSNYFEDLYEDVDIEDIYLDDNHHLNAYGHRSIAERLFQKIKKLPTA